MYEKFYGLSVKPFAVSPDPTFLYLGRHVIGKCIGCGTFDGRVLETTHAVELGFVQPLQQFF